MKKIKNSVYYKFKYDIIIFVILICIFLLLKRTNIEKLPNIFELDYEKSFNILNIIISTIGSIIGIFFAVFLFSFEISRQRLGRNALKYLIDSKYLYRFSALLVATLLFAFIAITTLSKEFNNNDLNTVYFSIFLFIISIILIIPFTINHLKTLVSEKFISKNINELDVKTINLYTNYNDITSNTLSLQEIENHPLMILNETTKRLINDGDINGLKYLFYNTNKKFLDILNQNILSDAEVDKFIENLLVIWQSIIEECKRVNTRIFFGIIWEGYRSFYEYAAKNKIDLRQYKKLLFYTFDFIDILFETNQQKCLLNGIQLLSSSFKTQLTNKNFPKEDEINRFYLENNILTIEDETNSDLNWKYLINILYCKEYLLSKAISLNKKNLVEYSFRYFNHLFYDIAESNKYHLGEKQEAHIVTTILFLIIDNKKNILNSKTGDEPQLFLMHSDLIISLIDKKKKYSKRIIEMYTEYLIFCQGNESINLTYFNFLIENWGDLCKKLAERFNHNNDYDKYILDVLGGLFNLKREIEREFLILKLSNYQTLKKVLSSIERVYRNNWYNQNKSKIESQINSNKSPDKIAEELAAKECLICSLIKNKIASFKHIEE